MSFQTLRVKLTPRVGNKPYNVQLNQATLEILSLIFEFKIATIGQIAKFLTQKDQSKYLYVKLHRMWQAELLESFKVSSGSYIGMPTYYMLSKQGLVILINKGIYDKAQIRSYPRIKALFSSFQDSGISFITKNNKLWVLKFSLSYITIINLNPLIS